MMSVILSKGGGAMKYSAKLRARNQLTLTPELLKQLDLNVGDEIELTVVDGKLIGIPKISVDKSQAWYWTPQWQEGEHEAEEELKELLNSRFEGARKYQSADDFLDDLKK